MADDADTVGFIGLGVMGGAIARHIAHAGHRLTLYNRTTERSQRWSDDHPGLAPLC